MWKVLDEMRNCTSSFKKSVSIFKWCCSTSGDRLLDIPCKVCGDRSSGKHYGIFSCDGKFIIINVLFYFY